MVSSDTVRDHLASTTTGLLVIDAQKAFASEEGSLARAGVDVSGPKAAVPRLRDLIGVARRGGCPVFYTGSERPSDGRADPAARYGLLPDVYADREPVCRAGSVDVEYVDGIEPAPDAYEVRKLRYDAFAGTPLATYLRLEAVETVLIAGFVTNGCVEMTARRAHERGFDVVLVKDCTAAFDERAHEAALHNVETLLGACVTLDAIRDAF